MLVTPTLRSTQTYAQDKLLQPGFKFYWPLIAVGTWARPFLLGSCSWSLLHRAVQGIKWHEGAQLLRPSSGSFMEGVEELREEKGEWGWEVPDNE